MSADDVEAGALRTVALRNAEAILRARKRAEDQLVVAKEALEERTLELSQSLSMMRATLESTADGILVTTVDGHVVTFNERFLGVWNMPREAVEGAQHVELLRLKERRYIGPGSLAGRIAAIYDSPGGESMDILELIDGRVVERYSRPQLLDGAIVGRVWSYRDITDRRRAEDAVREEARVLELINSTGSAIAATLDLQVVLQKVTDTATQLTGAAFGAFFYNSTEGENSYLLYVLTGAPREAFEKFGYPRATPLFGPTFRGEAPVRCDDVLADPRYGQWAPHHGMPEGHPPVRSYLTVPVKSRDGSTVGGLFFGHPKPGIFSDKAERLVVGIAAHATVAIDNARLYEETKRVAAEREILAESERSARVEIARTSQLKDEFLATLSHELRTPLSAMLGWAKVLLRKSDDAAMLERGLSAIERNAVAQARLIEDLLDMNSIVSGKVRLESQPVNLAAVVEVAIDSMRPVADAKGVSLHVDGEPADVAGDTYRLQQVVWNLLTNAVKYTPKGGDVRVQLRSDGDALEMRVIDSGIGISAEFMPYVFDRFRQADSSTTRSQGGLGLGLSIVKHLVELHGGSVQAESAGLDRGATFIVRLPLAGDVGARAPGTPDAPSPTVEGSPLTLAGVKVLIVDDEPDVCELLKHLLQESHAEVSTASSAAEAMTALQDTRPDLLLSDIGMPIRDGYQLIRDVRDLPAERGGKMPAIALTAFATSDDRRRALQAGFEAFLPKPVDVQALLDTVANLVRRAREQ